MFSKAILKNKHKLLFILFCVLIFVLGFYFRVSDISSRNLEYDEIWTLTHYSNKTLYFIFTELATPNNHPINSLLIKISILFFGINNIAIRLPVLIAGLSLTILVPLLCKRLFDDKIIIIVSFLLVSLNGPLVHYSQTARGYGLQAFVIFLFIFLIVKMEQDNCRGFLFCLFVCFLSPIISILILPTSILFVTPIMILHVLYLLFYSSRAGIKREKLLLTLNNKKIYLYIASFFIIVMWLLINYSQFKSGQQHGQLITSVGQFLNFISRIVSKVILWSVFIIVLIGILIKKRNVNYITLSILLIFAFVILSALVLKAGPARVYLSFVPIFIVGASASLYYLIDLFIKNKKLLYILYLFLGISFAITTFFKEIKNWTPVDFRKTFNLFCESMPKNCFISFPATSGYPASYDNSFGLIENCQRTPFSENQYIATCMTGNYFEGLDPKGQVSKIKTSLKPCKINMNNQLLYMYRLRPVKEDILLENKIIIMSLPIGEYEDINSFSSYLVENLKYENIIILNSWFRCFPLYYGKDNIKLTAAVFVIDKIALEATQLLSIQKRSGDKVRFYYLAPVLGSISF